MHFVYFLCPWCSESKRHVFILRVDSRRWNANWWEGDENIILCRNVKFGAEFYYLSLCNPTFSILEFSIRLNDYIHLVVKSKWLNLKVYISYLCFILSFNEAAGGTYLVLAIPLIKRNWHDRTPWLYSLLHLIIIENDNFWAIVITLALLFRAWNHKILDFLI